MVQRKWSTIRFARTRNKSFDWRMQFHIFSASFHQLFSLNALGLGWCNAVSLLISYWEYKNTILRSNYSYAFRVQLFLKEQVILFHFSCMVLGNKNQIWLECISTPCFYIHMIFPSFTFSLHICISFGTLEDYFGTVENIFETIEDYWGSARGFYRSVWGLYWWFFCWPRIIEIVDLF